eukprot:UC4_evm1s214
MRILYVIYVNLGSMKIDVVKQTVCARVRRENFMTPRVIVQAPINVNPALLDIMKMKWGCQVANSLAHRANFTMRQANEPMLTNVKVAEPVILKMKILVRLESITMKLERAFRIEIVKSV